MDENALARANDAPSRRGKGFEKSGCARAEMDARDSRLADFVKEAARERRHTLIIFAGAQRPAQLSNSWRAWAPASTWARRYVAIPSTRKFINRRQSAGCACMNDFVARKSREDPPSTR